MSKDLYTSIFPPNGGYRVHRILLKESLSAGKFNSLSLAAANGSIFLVAEYILTVSPTILDRFPLIILLKEVYGLPSAKVLRSRHVRNHPIVPAVL